MRIGHFAQPLCQKSKTGIGWYTYKLIYELISLGIESEVYAFDFLNRNHSKEIVCSLFDDFDKSDKFKCNINSFTHNGLYSRLDKLFSIIPFEFLFNSNPDLHHAHNYFLPYNVKSPSVVTIYDMVYKLYPETMDTQNLELLKKIMPRSVAESTKILTISKNSKKEIIDILDIDPQKISIAYPGFDKKEFHKLPESSIKPYLEKFEIRKPYLFYLGTLEPRKNLDRIIKAYAAIGSHKDSYDLVLAGAVGWKSESIFELINKYNLRDHIKIIGYISQEDKTALYNGATCFLYPSLYEGFGMPVLEAMACNCPVITSNTSSLPEVVGDAGVTVDPLNIDEISYSIIKLLDDVSLQNSMKEKNIIQIEHFSWNNTAKSVIQLYESIL